MKTLKLLLKALIFAAGAAAAAWVFMPWKQIGEAALISAGRRGNSPALTWAAVEPAPGGFVVENLDVATNFAGISCRTLTITPDIIFSVMNMAPACRISFTGGVLVTPSMKTGITLGDGRVTAALLTQGVLLEELRSNGELAMNGTMLLAPSSGRIINQASVMMNVKSEPFEKELSSLQRLFNLPLQQEAPGRWVLRRTAGDAQ